MPPERLELWRWDPVECMKELMGNPIFKDSLEYVPQKHFLDEEGNNRVFDEMWTGDWWWNTQVRSQSTCNSELELIRKLIIEKVTDWFNYCPSYSIIRQNPTLPIPR